MAHGEYENYSCAFLELLRGLSIKGLNLSPLHGTHICPSGSSISPGYREWYTGLSDTSPDEGLLEDLTVEDKAVEQLAEGLLSHYLPDLQRSKQALQELTQNQVVLLDTLEQEISKFKECHSMLDINALFTEAKHYHAKLVNIRKEMLMLHEKTSKLKKRALKLQQKRQKEELEREQQREKEFEREKQLTAKLAKRTAFPRTASLYLCFCIQEVCSPEPQLTFLFGGLRSILSTGSLASYSDD
ncbi:biogenesis of lysosome-related organelles complex 1 subunit 6 isoform X1 [Canis lupus familiaris]|uniref:biogenesis of lysosome-related organelles complex 1 subunit 6 isoform X1 n=1 Tax=Canis lupus familiaris TaxID=9615 RepID=UPI0015F12F0E|nr:biogenesis of lysosome-related organelles complex 1 subunit 6 isoform X1 [Canis lupus familiaris]XP_038436243.1 biogenesis of lysosome-related organelles complex 1 subunit 6 isoform X1 [Canis lupus familiaris]